MKNSSTCLLDRVGYISIGENVVFEKKEENKDKEIITFKNAYEVMEELI